MNDRLNVFSAGTHPAEQVHPMAVKVMKEIGIDLSGHSPENVSRYLDSDFDFVITVCDHAKETCPVFIGKVDQQLHLGFEDPAKVRGTEEEILKAFRQVRDEIQNVFLNFYKEKLENLK